MAALDFPSNPTNGQTYALNGVTYYYNSSMGAWLTQLTSMNLSTSSNTQVLFNDAGLANGSSGLVFNKVAGYLGIGTTTPNSSLHLSSSSRTYISVTANAKDWLIDHRGTYDSGSNALSFAYDGTERMRIDSSGNVGIGTSSPQSHLHLEATNPVFRIRDLSASGGIAFIGTDVTGLYFRSFTADTTRFLKASGTEIMRIDTNGAVLIGNTVSAQVGTNYPTITRNSASAQLLLQRGNDSAGWGAIGADDTFAFNVYNQSFGAKVFAVTQTNGKVVLKGGNSTDSGTGISFPATQSASSDANTLDDYEEGTWTPAYSAAAGTATHNQQTGYYIKVGRNVTVWFIIRALRGTLSSGNLIIGGLPFTTFSSNMDYGYTVRIGAVWGGWATIPVTMYATNNATWISLWDTGTSYLTFAALPTTGEAVLLGQLNYLSNS